VRTVAVTVGVRSVGVCSRMSRRYALRYGFTIITDYMPRRRSNGNSCCGSLLWRLRRIIAIETDLFQIQAEILRDRRNEGL
jgi:hypothetical protein